MDKRRTEGPEPSAEPHDEREGRLERRLFIFRAVGLVGAGVAMSLAGTSEVRAQTDRDPYDPVGRGRGRGRVRPGGDPGWGHQDSSSGGGADRTSRGRRGRCTDRDPSDSSGRGRRC